MSATEYRPEIDGLRAVAIVPVILFHLGLNWMPGGFLGVDVFFVISGFLITSILLREMATGTFSFQRFWARRVRRILPALLVVTVATLAAAWILVFPPDRPAVGRQALATLLSAANFYFWRHAGDYWGPQAEESPFLHAWSLAVEEQFYILYPVLVHALVRWAPKRIAAGLISIIAASFGLFLYGIHTRPAATFYLLPTRAWELATGGLLAAVMHGRGRDAVAPRGAAAAAGAGLCAMIGSYALLPELNGWAVIPVAGAAAVIGCGSHGWVKRVLSNPAVVYVGKTSYSLYLWHWPVIVLSRQLRFGVPDVVLVLVIAGLAVASYHLVEEPLRRRPDVIPKIAGGFVGALACAVALLVLPAARIDTSGFSPLRIVTTKYDVNPHPQASDEWEAIFAAMHASSSLATPEDFRGEGILVGSGDGSPDVVVLGDSHGCMWAGAIGVAVEDVGRKAAMYCMAGESPFVKFPPGVERRSRKLTAAEKHDYDVARVRAIERWRPDVVIICARWAIVKPGDAEDMLGFLQDHAERVLLVEQPPELADVGHHSASEYAAFRGIRPQPGTRQYWRAGNVEAHEAGRQLMRSLAARFPKCEVVSTADLFTAGNGVWFLDGATVLYADDDHLTADGALVAVPRLIEFLSRRSPPTTLQPGPP